MIVVNFPHVLIEGAPVGLLVLGVDLYIFEVRNEGRVPLQRALDAVHALRLRQQLAFRE